MNDARNWKWMVPGVGFVFLMLMTRGLLLSEFEWVRWFGVGTGLTGAVCAVAAIGNYMDYRLDQSVRILERKRRLMVLTPLSAELEAARHVHPEAVKVLINERHRIWMLKSGVRAQGVTPHSVLYGAPDVTDIFLDYFLRSSTDTVVMPKRLLVDGRKNRFDPWGAVNEYTMYDHLIELLVKQGKVQKYSEYDPFMWVDPWAPALVAEDYGLEWEETAEPVVVNSKK